MCCWSNVVVWWRKEWGGFKNDIKKWKNCFSSLFLKGKDADEKFVKLDFYEFTSLFERKDGVYYIGNHRLADSFGIDELKRLWYSSPNIVLTWSAKTLNIYARKKETLSCIALMNTGVPRDRADETMENLRRQWAMKLEILEND